MILRSEYYSKTESRNFRDLERAEMMQKGKHYVIKILVKSLTGHRPRVRTFGGDTIFVWLDEGMTAKWKVKEGKK